MSHPPPSPCYIRWGTLCALSIGKVSISGQYTQIRGGSSIRTLYIISCPVVLANNINNLDRLSSPSQQASSCSSLHKLIGAQYTGESSLLFYMPRKRGGGGLHASHLLLEVIEQRAAVLPGPKKVSLPLQLKTTAISAPSTATFHTSYFYTFLGLHAYIYAKIFSSEHFTMNSQNFLIVLF
jgi:hypothetical protein